MKYVNRFGTNDKVYYEHRIRSNYSTSSKYNPNCMDVARRIPMNMIELLKAYNLTPFDIKDDYAYFYTMFYLTSQLQNIMKVFPKKEWTSEAKKLKGESFYYNFIPIAHFSLKRNKKYFVLHYLFRIGLYQLIFFLYGKMK